MALTAIEAGGADNRVPDRAAMRLDVRYPDHVDGGDVQQRLREAVDYAGVSIEMTNLARASSYDHDGDVAQAWLRALAEAGGRDEAPRQRTAGASNGRYWDHAGATVLMTNPTGGNAHAAGEWVAVDAIAPFLALVDRTFELTAVDDGPH